MGLFFSRRAWQRSIIRHDGSWFPFESRQGILPPFGTHGHDSKLALLVRRTHSTGTYITISTLSRGSSGTTFGRKSWLIVDTCLHVRDQSWKTTWCRISLLPTLSLVGREIANAIKQPKSGHLPAGLLPQDRPSVISSSAFFSRFASNPMVAKVCSCFCQTSSTRKFQVVEALAVSSRIVMS
jgi:hypothetical protein